MALPENLLDDVKGYLDITWEDTATDKKLTGIIERGMARLNRIAGTELDFTEEDQGRELLFDYCRYARSNALEEFEKNFLSEILALQIGVEVATYEEPDV